MSQASLNGLLKKTEHYDKDERYMATSDLCAALQRHAAALGASAPQGSSSSNQSSSGSSAPYQYGSSSSSHHQSNNPNCNIIPIDASMERRICTAILALLDDDSNDVQAIAVKTLGVLLTTVHEEQVLEITERLIDLVLDESKSDLRDVYTIGLRTLIKTIPIHMGNGVSFKLVSKLLKGIHQENVQDIQLASLDILTDLLSRFGAYKVVAMEQERILNVILKQLNSLSAMVKKRAGVAIGCLAVVIGDGLLFRLVDTLLAQINLGVEGSLKGITISENSPAQRSSKRLEAQKMESERGADDTPTDTRALIRTMCTISGTVGHRLGRQIDRIIPIFLQFCQPSDAVSGDDMDNDIDMEDADDDGALSNEMEDDEAAHRANELRESCFAGFESFILRCPLEVQPHMPQMIDAALAFMTYDPNYSYGDDDDDNGNNDDNDDDDEYSEDEFSDEEDMSDDDDDDSWKVRRSAIRALTAVVDAMKADPSKLWTEYGVANALVKRFKEREENCRVDVIDCFTRLLAITVESIPKTLPGGGDAMDAASTGENAAVLEGLRTNFIPAIVRACEKQLSAKRGGERTKSSALALLSTTCLAPGGIGGADQIGVVFSHVKSILNEPSGSKSLKLDALCLVRIALSCDQHQAADVRACLVNLLPELCKAVQEDWYKVIAEALRVLSEIPRLLIQPSADQDQLSSDKVAMQLFSAIEPRLAAHDLDQEIKECSLSATAALLSMLHSHLPSAEQNKLLELILERLKNETTRLAALKTLSIVAAAGDHTSGAIDLDWILDDAVKELASLLRQQSRGLKQSALEALDIIMKGHGEGMKVELFEEVLREAGGIISDGDLHISHLSLRVAISILKASPSSGALVQSYTLPPALVLSTSPLLQDLALDSLLSLLRELVASNAVSFSELHSKLKHHFPSQSETGDMAISKPAVSNLAKCIAVITCATTEENRNEVVNDLIISLKSNAVNSNKAELNLQLSLLTSGEIGQRVDLSSVSTSVGTDLQTIYLSSFDSSNEEIKAAAAYALGHAAVGSMSNFLPAILSALENSTQKKQYLLLSAMKEVIKCHESSGKDLSESIPMVLPHLVGHLSAKEEGVRTMVAECMGSLSCLQPREILPKLQELTSEHGGKAVVEEEEEASEDALVCWTVATSVKFAISHRANSTELESFMPTFLGLLNEKDLSVKTAALLMVYSAVHHTPMLLAGLMREHVLPALYELAQLNLKRVVDLGPFKHTVDDALPLRKASLSIFATSLENCPSSLDIPLILPILAKALDDVEDVQLQAHHIVISMCSRHPEEIFTGVESFVEPLEKTINKKKGNKTGTELERVNEWIKSGLRVMIALSQVEGAMSCRKLSDFFERTKKNHKFQPFLKMLEEER